MESIRKSTIDGFNSFVLDQQAAPGETNLSLLLFNTGTEHRHQSVPIAQIPPLNPDTYVPNGGTALLDAIGETIDRLGQQLAALPESERPGHVTVAILTDGDENSSRHYSWLQIADRIKHQTETYSWEFLFLGAGPDTIATAGRMNIDCFKVALFTADDAGSTAAFKSSSRKSISERAKKFGYATEQQLKDAEAPLADIQAQEDSIARK